MGNTKLSIENAEFRVCTLNYSGIIISPFEYYSSESLEEQRSQQSLSRTFRMLCETEKGWNLASYKGQNKTGKVLSYIFKEFSSIDKKVKKQRYCPLYHSQCGVENKKFLTRQQFFEHWNRKWFEGQPNKRELENASQENIRLFDFLVYKSILCHVYQSSDIDYIIDNKGVTRYFQYMELMSKRKFMDDQYKLNLVLKYINDGPKKVDVVFMQNTTAKMVEQLEKMSEDFRIVTGSPQACKQDGYTALLIRNSKFKKASVGRKSNLKFRRILEDESFCSQKNKIDFLKWNKASFVSLDNFIFISTHYTHPEIYRKMRKELVYLQEIFPKKYLVVAGIMKVEPPKNITSDHVNANIKAPSSKHEQLRQKEQEMEDHKFWKGFQRYPQAQLTSEQEPVFTTFKKRTCLQTQFAKADQVTKQCSTFIIYDRRLEFSSPGGKEQVIVKSIRSQVKDSKVGLKMTRQKSEVKQKYLPSNEHPFDHYILAKQFKIPKRKPKTSNNNQLYGISSSSSSEDIDDR